MIVRSSIVERLLSISSCNGMLVSTTAVGLVGPMLQFLRDRSPSADNIVSPAARLHLKRFPRIFPVIQCRSFSWADLPLIVGSSLKEWAGCC